MGGHGTAEEGLERIDLLGHSAGGNVALRYAAAYPERIDHLVLLSPGPQPLGLDFTDAQRQAAVRGALVPGSAGRDTGGRRRRRLGREPPALPAVLLRPLDDAARAHALVGFN